MSRDQWRESRATPSSWDSWAHAENMAAHEQQQREEAEYEAVREAEYRAHMEAEYEAWAWPASLADIEGHRLRVRRSALGPMMYAAGGTVASGLRAAALCGRRRE